MKTERSKPPLLCPAQERALAGLEHALKMNHYTWLWGGGGSGKTTVLRELQRRTGAAWLSARDFAAEAMKGDPNGLEESFVRVVTAALKKHEMVVVDDIGLLDFNRQACGQYERAPFWNLLGEALLERAEALGRKVVLGTSGQVPECFRNRSYPFWIGKFEPEDYAVLLGVFLGARARGLDAKKIHRFAPGLDAHDLRMACKWMAATRRKFGTEEFIEYLRSQRLTSNVNLGEVQAVDLKSLLGVEDVIRALETHVILPLENDELAERLALRPKRGVLLYGPPGTGKTTVGRALAHRLKGKFFLIDGTFIAGAHDFYGRVHQVFQAAKANAPAVIFIDDADAIFQNNEEQGLYRYLLTMLDGLESEGRTRVCVMMTAMDLGDLPPALVRSGRVEVWLGMRLPDHAARVQILQALMTALPPELAGVDLNALAAATDGLTGADLKRSVEDAKALYAYAVAHDAPKPVPMKYFTEAIETIRANKELYDNARAAGGNSASSRTRGFPFPPPGVMAALSARFANQGGIGNGPPVE
jgi:ATP-dependent 26S proteasome regulatory subunit